MLLFGARTPVELLYGDEFRAFAERHPRNFRFVPCFSRELPAQPHADVRHGYVQQFLAEFAPDAATDIAYLCGNPNMVDACFEALKAARPGGAADPPREVRQQQMSRRVGAVKHA